MSKKVTIRISLKSFLESEKKRTEKLIDKTGHETQSFWAGYNQCCQDLLQKYFPDLESELNKDETMAETVQRLQRQQLLSSSSQTP